MKFEEVKYWSVSKIFYRFLFYPILIIMITFGFILFFSQPKFQSNDNNIENPSILNSFFNSFHSSFPARFVKGWFNIDSSEIKMTVQEKVIENNLISLKRHINLYFESLLKETQKFINTPIIYNIVQNKKSYNGSTIQVVLEDYLRNNLDLIEVGLFSVTENGIQKIFRTKYKQIKSYQISDKIIQKLSFKNNILIKNSLNNQLVLVSAIKKNQELTGFITQTINTIFFTKILDFLGLNKNLFFLKTQEGNVIVDNYKTYKYYKDSDQKNTLSLFYKPLFEKKMQESVIKIDNINYRVGTIIKKNNMLGNTIAILLLCLLLYFAIVITTFFIKNISSISNTIFKNRALTKHTNSFSSDGENEEIYNHDNEVEQQGSPVNSEIKPNFINQNQNKENSIIFDNISNYHEVEHEFDLEVMNKK